ADHPANTVGHIFTPLVIGGQPKPEQAVGDGVYAQVQASDGRKSTVEVEAWEQFAREKGLNMAEHPLHYLFLDEKTSTARQAWSAAIRFVLDAPRPAVATAGDGVAFNFAAHLQRQRDWSGKTFGPGSRSQGVVDHIRKELKEIEADPGDLKEWIDVVILALDGAWRSGAQPQEIIDALVSKQTKNEGRVWPDWRTADPNKAIEHDRSHDALASRPVEAAQGGVPEGWESKPREPTPEMLKACDTVIQGYGAKLVWQRMYDAAPEVPATTRDAGDGEVRS
ncbi:dATP/dGTP pyrophosphohydrolase domain-containing protein, partial [Luteibacter sp. NPDC031894]|uniref:dATP/dGTP pyrophosphohydrolase domain-containing protein n=1 Tax=Luteibacter sp. NPDC031894 TaxID=3390572 RepID=UPI003D035DBA